MNRLSIEQLPVKYDSLIFARTFMPILNAYEKVGSRMASWQQADNDHVIDVEVWVKEELKETLHAFLQRRRTDDNT
jgi:hypothetical protein